MKLFKNMAYILIYHLEYCKTGLFTDLLGCALDYCCGSKTDDEFFYGRKLTDQSTAIDENPATDKQEHAPGLNQKPANENISADTNM